MTRARPKRMLFSIAGFAGVGVFWAQACQLTTPDEQAEPPSSSSITRSAETVAPRFALDVERAQIERALTQTRDYMDLVREDYQRWAALLAWTLGDARPADPGPALAQCYVDFAPGISGECLWGIRLVIERQQPQLGEVVYLEVLDSTQNPSCKPLLECVAKAWQGASAPLPETEDQYIAIEFGGIPCTLGEGLSGPELHDKLAERQAMASKSLASMESCSGDACEHNRQVDAACLAHVAEMRRHLETARP